jgi:hypothetical protein
MRINLWLNASERPPPSLLLKWGELLSKEYLVSVSDAGRWITQRDHMCWVAQVLRDKGWKVEAYHTPFVGDRCQSYGYVVADDCEHFVAWRLSQG